MTDSTEHNLADQLHRFLFDADNVRGELVQLGPSFSAMIANHDYPPAVAELLGELLAATSLFTALLKFEGEVTVQLQGDGPVRLMVVNGDHRQQFRGVARISNPPGELTGLRALLGTGYLVITVSPTDGERYQGVVALDEESIAACLERYFSQSEQLPTSIWLFARASAPARAAGLLLQRMPVSASEQDDRGLEHLVLLTTTLKAEELLDLPAITVLHRLYHQEQINLFSPQPLTFVCGCSRKKSANALISLGRDDCEALLAERGEICIHCEYCNSNYRFTDADIEPLFGSGTRHGPH
ncbi:MAG: Hsp33 family molecular chaperone HslO [Gammaproteobacteria bacterium]|nr:Hsp33 family molecular chaperone HslO [Gammaproteobacteria bacterium]